MAHRRLRYFRRNDEGVRIPYTLVLDHELTMVEHYAEMHEVNERKDARVDVKKRIPETPARKKAILMARWATKAVEENPFPGSEDLRQEYFKAIEELHEKHHAKGSKCPSCELGKVARRYNKKLEAAGFLDNL